MTTMEAPTASTLDLARECLYRFLAACLSDPRGPTGPLLQDQDNLRLAGAAADLLRADAASETVPLGFGELPPDDLDLTEIVSGPLRSIDELASEYDRVFGMVSSRECQPYETEHCPAHEPFYRSQQLADVAGFYQAFGLTRGQVRPERQDHIALELEFMAHLLLLARMADDGTHEGDARASVCRDAAQRFFRDHLAWWIASFAAGLQFRAQDGPYATAARVLAAFVPTERVRFIVKATKTPVQPTPLACPEEESEGCAACPSHA